MENLIQDYLHRIELQRNETIEKIKQTEQVQIKEVILILTGKLFAYDICLNELYQLLKYHKESFRLLTK